MPAWKVSHWPGIWKIKCPEITCKMTSQAPVLPRVDQTNGWKQIISCSLLLVFFFSSPAPRPLPHILLPICKEPNLESFRLASGALIFLEGRKTSINDVRSGWMVASSSLQCQGNESRIPSPLPKSQWLVIKFPLTVCFITSVSLLTYNRCCWEVELVNDFLLHIDISTWRGNIFSSEYDYYFEILSTGGKSTAIN